MVVDLELLVGECSRTGQHKITLEFETKLNVGEDPVHRCSAAKKYQRETSAGATRPAAPGVKRPMEDR